MSYWHWGQREGWTADEINEDVGALAARHCVDHAARFLSRSVDRVLKPELGQPTPLGSRRGTPNDPPWRRAPAPQPMSNSNRSPPTSTSVLGPFRSGVGTGDPVPSNVTLNRSSA